MKNICIFGDSVAKGVVFDETLNRYVFLKDCFANLFSEKEKVPVKNYAKFGCTVAKGAEMVRRHEQELSGYDFTVLEFGGNDCDMNWAEIAADPKKDHQPNMPAKEFEENYDLMVSQIKQNGGRPIILSLPPLDARRFFDWVSKGLDRINILNFLGGDVEYIYRWHEMYNGALYRIASKHDVPVIDIREAFLKDKNYGRLLCADGMHPNAAGHDLILSTIKKYISTFKTAS